MDSLGFAGMSENMLKSRSVNLRDHRSAWAPHDTVGGSNRLRQRSQTTHWLARNLRHSIQDSRFLFKAETFAGISFRASRRTRSGTRIFPMPWPVKSTSI